MHCRGALLSVCLLALLEAPRALVVRRVGGARALQLQRGPRLRATDLGEGVLDDDADASAPRKAVISNARQKKSAKGPRLPDLSQAEFPPVPPDDEPYDLVVIGSGPGGESCATRAAQLGAKVAVVELKRAFGGPTGLTSKAVREAAERIVGAVEQIGGDRRKQMAKLWRRNFPSFRTEAEIYQAAETRRKYQRDGVDLFVGQSYLTPEDETCGQLKVRVCRPTHCVELPTRNIVIATGSRPARPEALRSGATIPWQPGVVVDSTAMGTLSDLPKVVAIIGGGVIAVEYATVLSRLGVGVSLLCSDSAFLPFLPSDVRRRLRRRLQRDRVQVFDTAERPIERIDVRSDGRAGVVLSGKGAGRKLALRVDMVLFSSGRDANSDGMGVENLGVSVGKYGRIVVDKLLRTTRDSVFAIGDVIQPPADDFPAGLASAAAAHGRLVADQLFQPGFVEECQAAPTTLWTLPEISTVGMSIEAAEAAAPGRVVVGRAFYRDSARGRLSGDGDDGFLRLVAVWQPGAGARPGAHVLVGVSIIGAGANELVQLGSMQVALGLSLEQLSMTPFAAVTLTGLYQAAANEALRSSPHTASVAAL